MKTKTQKFWRETGVIVMMALFVFSFQLARAAEITEKGVVELVNQARVKEQLNPVVVNEKLSQAAADKAEDMLKNNYFAHTSPAGVTPWDWISGREYKYSYAGENLAMGFVDLVEQQQAWMKSATHRQNILNSHYQEIGIAVRKGLIENKLATITVQEFGARKDFVAAGPKTEPSQVAQKQVLGEKNSQVLQGNKTDIYRALNYGLTGVLGLAVAGSLSIAGYLAVDSLVLEYLESRRRKQTQLALHLLDPTKM